MKWWKKLLVLLVAGVVCGAIMRVMALWVSKNTLSASAAEQTYGDLTYVLHNGNAEITGCAAGVTALEIPAEIDGSPVTAVGDSAFLKQQKLQTVSLPDSVQSIGSQAFSGCINLQEITFRQAHSLSATPLFPAAPIWKRQCWGTVWKHWGAACSPAVKVWQRCSFPPTCRKWAAAFSRTALR